MPGNGRADWVGGHFEQPGRPDYRTVYVKVNGYSGSWWNTLARVGSSGSWSGWTYAPPAAVRPAHP